MAESTSVALAAAPFPTPAEISRAEKLVRERFVHPGEDPQVALAPGTPRRRALDQALAELRADPKAKHPSTEWRREFSLLLGLERLLSEEEPRLADGTVLSAHQVDALSGTLAALLAEAQSPSQAANGRAAASASPELLASADILGPDDVEQASDANEPPPAAADSSARDEDSSAGDEEEEEEEDEDGEEEDLDDEDEDLGPVQRAAPDDEEDDEDEEEDDEAELISEEETEEDAELRGDSEEEPRDWVEDEDEDDALAEQPEDPNAAKRFWFEHATGAGKTVAALGFVEASQTGGVLILTHRRNLVDQFNGELRDRGYSKRVSRPLLKGEDSVKAGGRGPLPSRPTSGSCATRARSRAPTRS